MKCPKCGNENPQQANFCGSCGAPLHSSETEMTIGSAELKSDEQTVPVSTEPVVEPKEEPVTNNETGSFNTAGQSPFGQGSENNTADGFEPPKKSRNWMVIGACALIAIAAVGVGAFFLFQDNNIESYDELMAQGNRYLENMDYTAAKDAYLKALSIDPKQKEVYLALSQVAQEQDLPEEAVEWIEQMEEEVPETRVMTLSYDLQPYEPAGIELDPEFGLYVLPQNGSLINDNNVQVSSLFTPAKAGSDYSLFSGDGTNHTGSWSGIAAGAEDYLVEMDGLTYRLVGDQLELWDAYLEQSLAYSYDNALNFTGISLGFDENIPVAMTSSYYDGGTDPVQWIGENSVGYGLVNPDGYYVSDTDYEYIAGESNGLYAAKKDGKWGYLDGSGNVVIPLEFESSWSTPSGELAYGASKDTIVVRYGGEYGLINTRGSIIIPFGTFEELLPVMENGGFWAKKNGDWNLYSVGVQLASQPESEPDEELTTANHSETPVDFEYSTYQIVDEDIPEFEDIPLYIRDGNYLFEEKNKFGAIDYLGDVTIDPDYKYARVYKYTLSQVMDEAGAINACLYSSGAEPGEMVGLDKTCDGSSGGGVYSGKVVYTSLDEPPVVVNWNDEPASDEEIGQMDFNADYGYGTTYQVFKEGVSNPQEYYLYNERNEQYYGPYSLKDEPAFKLIPSDFDDGLEFRYDKIGESTALTSGLIAIKEDGGYRFMDIQTLATSQSLYDEAIPVSENAFMVKKGDLVGIVSSDLRLFWFENVEEISAIYDQHAYAKIDGKWVLIEFDEDISTDGFEQNAYSNYENEPDTVPETEEIFVEDDDLEDDYLNESDTDTSPQDLVGTWVIESGMMYGPGFGKETLMFTIPDYNATQIQMVDNEGETFTVTFTGDRKDNAYGDDVIYWRYEEENAIFLITYQLRVEIVDGRKVLNAYTISSEAPDILEATFVPVE